MTVENAALALWSVGHSNLSGAEFVGVLESAAIQCVVDVRAYPASRRHPHFARKALTATLAAAGIDYVWEGAALGGRRKSRADSPHTALDENVRGFADHMASGAFQQAIVRLMALAAKRRSAIMCAEKLPSQCHRSLICDALAVRSITVLHLVHAMPPACHVVSRLVRVRGETLVYDGGAQLPLL